MASNVSTVSLRTETNQPNTLIPNSDYSDNSVAAFANFKFVHSVGSAIAFLYSSKLTLHHQLWLLALVAVLSTICFCLVEWRARAGGSPTNELEKSESRQNIVKVDAIKAHQRSSYGTSDTFDG